MEDRSYVLVSAARNEELHIEHTLRAVICQTVLPKKWVIVSDSSTDRTDEIASQYSKRYKYIQLIRVDAGSSRNFTSKVNAFRKGTKELKFLEYGFIGNLDVDVSFDAEYFEEVLEKFSGNPKLGIAGGAILESMNDTFEGRFGNTERSVPGAIQLFRRECYEQIGSYVPLKLGGEDTAAEMMARMRGWEVRSFPELPVLHLRGRGGGMASTLSAISRQGGVEYILGSHPLFVIGKCCRRILERPYVLGSMFRMFGYCRACLRKEKRLISGDIVDYIRRGQMARLRALFEGHGSDI